MEQKKKVLATFVLLVVLAGGFWLITRAITTHTGYSITEIEDLDEFTKCLGENSVELYVSSTCPHCITQKSMFKEYVDNLKIIDCTKEEYLCIEKEIFKVPTWIINGEKQVGIKSFEELSDLTGCEITK